VFEAPLAPSRKLARVRLETPEETEIRLRTAADAVARNRERQAAQATPDMFGAKVGTSDGDDLPDATKAAEEFDGLF